MTGFLLTLLLILGILLMSQRKQFEYQLELERLKYRQRESEFQELRETVVSRESDLVKELRQELAEQSHLAESQSLMIEGLQKARVQASEWDLQ